jgi:ABC-type polysaccharide/polyol phosphate transport system ATPase subunit
MSLVVIQGEGLGKHYHRGALQASSLLRDQSGRFLKSPLSFFRRPTEETFWAQKDVSLEIREGEVLGLIGRNGAGKTTLLKILSRITRPTTGRAEIYGRVGSLLEVGTGFHPELTGRENTLLSGAILGMGKREITRKFDEIGAFAELEKFIDTLVKHHSRGMYVRLACAVAAHLEPEILLVDEVLALGDINFQKKCLGKMGDVVRAGRTVVTTIEFTVAVFQPIHDGHHGCALLNHDRQLIWAWATDGVQLDVGHHRLSYTFPMLPSRPGPYTWQVSLYDDCAELDVWECLPEMIIATEGFQHTDDEWNGVLNIPSRFQITTSDQPARQRSNVPTSKRSDVSSGVQRSNVPTFKQSDDSSGLERPSVPTFERSNDD